MRLLRRLILSFILMLWSVGVAAANGVYDENRAELSRVEEYLQNIKYFQAGFIQDNLETHEMAEGSFYLSRPGKLRIEYTTPFEAILITNGSNTVYYDVELQETTNIETKSTPIHFLTRKNFSFDSKDLAVAAFSETDWGYSVSVFEAGKRSNGLLILTFKKDPMMLESIEVINELNQRVVVKFFSQNTKNIGNDKFIFKNKDVYNRFN